MIQTFAQTFFCVYKDYTLPATIGAGAAVESAFLAKKFYQNPSCLKDRIDQIIDRLKTLFSQQKEETSDVFHKRLVINIVKLTGAALLVAACATFPFVIMPLCYAIPVAISTTYYLGKLLCNLDRLRDFFQSKKTWIVNTFTKRKDESSEDFKKRLFTNIPKAIFYVLFAAAAVALVVYIGGFFLPKAIQIVASGGFDLYSLLPTQTPLVVFLEYLSLGALHLFQAISAYRTKNKVSAVFHSTCAFLSIFFPVSYATALISGGLRLHHSFIGLLLQLTPWRPVQIFGSVITFDSFLYIFAPGGRGCPLLPLVPGGVLRLNDYDFMNTVVDNLSFVLNGLVGTSFVQEMNGLLPEKNVSEENTL